MIGEVVAYRLPLSEVLMQQLGSAAHLIVLHRVDGTVVQPVETSSQSFACTLLG